MKFVQAIATVGGFTLLSRVLGLIRDMTIAAFLGAGPSSDAFVVAFRFPNFFRRLFAEGALNAAFVPIFSRLNATEGFAIARQSAEQVFMVLFTSLVILVAFVELTLPWLMYVIAPGFGDNPEQFKLGLNLTRITFPYILFVSLAAFYSGILNSLGKFSAAAANPVILNIMMICFLLLGSKFDIIPVWALAVSVLTAGILQVLYMGYVASLNGIKFNLVEPVLTPTVVQLIKAMVPGALGAGIMQINLLVDTILASEIPGAVSYLYYADRLNQFPLGLLGIGISTVLLPVLSRHFEKGEKDAVQNIQNRTLEFSLALTLPACLALIILAEPLILLIFGHKEFNSHDVQETAKVLAAYSFGLPAYVLIKVLSTSFFARYDTKTPVITAIIAMLTNIILNLILMQHFEYVGIAAATAITAWLNAGILAWRLYENDAFHADLRLKIRLPRLIIATIIMALSIYYLNVWLGHTFKDSLIHRCLSLSVLVISGVSVYIGAASFLRGIYIKELLQFLRDTNKKT